MVSKSVSKSELVTLFVLLNLCDMLQGVMQHTMNFGYRVFCAHISLK